MGREGKAGSSRSSDSAIGSKMKVEELERRLVRLEESVGLILEWALDKKNLWKLKELVEGCGGSDDRLGAQYEEGDKDVVEGKSEPEESIAGDGDSWGDDAFLDLDQDFGNDSVAGMDDDRVHYREDGPSHSTSSSRRYREVIGVEGGGQERLNPFVKLVRLKLHKSDPDPEPQPDPDRSQKKKVKVNPLKGMKRSWSSKRKGDWTCVVCNEVFPTSRTLRSHTMTTKHYNYKGWKCTGRPMTDLKIPREKQIFPSPSSKRKGDWTCIVCKEVFPTARTLSSHRMTAKHYKGWNSKYKSPLIDLKIPCQKCEEIFPSPIHLARHTRTKHKMKKSESDNPGPGRSKIVNVKLQKGIKKRGSNSNSNRRIGNWTCVVCNEIFPTIRELRSHRMTTKHYKVWSNIDLKIPCDKCEEIFPSQRQLTLHARTKHKVKKSAWHTCPHCDYEVYGNGKFLNHVRKHTGEAPWLCSICGKRVKTEEYLKIHTKLHSAEGRPHICKYCGKGFKTHGSMRLHEKIHEGKRDFACPHCNIRTVNLQKHILSVHEKLRRYACHLCDHKFKQKYHLDRHVRTHSNPNRRVKGYHIERPEKPNRKGVRSVLRFVEHEDEDRKEVELTEKPMKEGKTDLLMKMKTGSRDGDAECSDDKPIFVEVELETVEEGETPETETESGSVAQVVATSETQGYAEKQDVVVLDVHFEDDAQIHRI